MATASTFLSSSSGSIVLVFDRMGSDFLMAKSMVVVFQIADGDSFVIAKFEESIVDLITTVTQTDVAHADLIVCA